MSISLKSEYSFHRLQGTSRLNLEGLPGDLFSVAVREDEGHCSCLTNLTHKRINQSVFGAEAPIWINRKSAQKRLLVDLNEVTDLPALQRLAAARLSLPQNVNIWPQEALKALVSHRAKALEGKTVRLSASDLKLPTSVFMQNDFVAYDVKGKETLGRGSYARIKTSLLPNGKVVARRINLNILAIDGITIMELLRGKRGIIPILARGVYFSKNGSLKVISFHEVYSDLNRLRELDEARALDCIHQLLCGWRTIAKIGIHRDIKPGNVLFRELENHTIELAIADFDSFLPRGYRGNSIYTTLHYSPPEIRILADSGVDNDPRVAAATTEKLDSWGIGHCIESIRSSCKSLESNPKIAEIIAHLFKENPKERWDSKQTLSFFESQVYKPKS